MAAQRRTAFPPPTLLAVAAGVFAFISFLMVGCTNPAGQAKLLVPNTSLQLTDGVPGEQLVGSFILRNVGGERLVIGKLEADCGCSSLEISHKEVLSGGEAVLQVTVRLKPDGQPLQFPVRVFTNDPASPVTVLTVRAEVAPAPLRAEPAQVAFGELALGSEPVQCLRLLRPSGEPWPAGEMIEVAAHAGLATARVIQVGHADLMKSLAVEVRPRRNLPEGPFSDTLTIRPADGKRPLLVPVQGRVVPRLLVSPTTILFSDVARQTGPMQRHVLLRRTDGKHLSIQKWTAPAGIQLEEVPAPKGAEARVRKLLQVTLSPAGVSRDFRDERLLLWLEDEPEPLCVQVIVFMDQKKTGSAH